VGEVTSVSASSMFITAQGGQIEVAKGKLGSGKKLSRQIWELPPEPYSATDRAGLHSHGRAMNANSKSGAASGAWSPGQGCCFSCRSSCLYFQFSIAACAFGPCVCQCN